MEKDFDRWNEKKKRIHIADFADFVNEREVWWCALGLNVGVEADGKHDNFERPVLVVRKFNKDSVLIVPLTSHPKDNPYYIPFKHEGREFAAIISQMRLISTNRLLRLIYKMDNSVFKTVQISLSENILRIPVTNRPPLARGPRRPHGHN